MHERPTFSRSALFGALRRSLVGRANRWLLAAVIVGFVLRLAWAVFAAQTPPHLTDPWQYQEIAKGFAHGHLPAIGFRPSAFWPPGYPLALAPIAWLSDRLGFDLSLAAALLNAVAGTVTVIAVAALAHRWIGRSARVPAAWLMALAPGPIFLTSTSLSETWFTALAMLVLWLTGMAIDRGWPSMRFAAIGGAVGYLTLVRAPGILLIAVVPLVVRATGGRWRMSVRPLAAAGIGILVVLAPWTVRNGMQVGAWTPVSTNNAAFLCIGNGPGADGRFHNDLSENARCYRRSPFDNPSLYRSGEVPPGFVFDHPDEAAWYATTLRTAASSIVRHPFAQPARAARRVFDTFSSDSQSLSDAEGFGRQPLVGARARNVLSRAADLWFWGVLALAALGLLFVRRCRAALPVWGLAGLQVVAFLPGIGIERYHQPIMPLLVILAAGSLVVRAAGRSSAAVLTDSDPEPKREATAELAGVAG